MMEEFNGNFDNFLKYFSDNVIGVSLIWNPQRGNHNFKVGKKFPFMIIYPQTVRVIFGDVLIENKNQLEQVYKMLLDSQELCNVPLFNMGS